MRVGFASAGWQEARLAIRTCGVSLVQSALDCLWPQLLRGTAWLPLTIKLRSMCRCTYQAVRLTVAMHTRLDVWL
jgi:hypothetical protein